PGVRQNYGKLLRELERYPESERELRLAVEQSDDDLEAKISLAATLVAERKQGEASQVLDAVLAKSPQHPDALGVKGQLLLSEGRTREALPYFEQATSTSAPEPFIDLAHAYLAAGDAAKARQAAEEALRRSPGHPWAMGVLGAALAAEKQRDQALQD